MAPGAMRDRPMKRLSNVLLHHENEAVRGVKGFLFRQGQLFHADFIMKRKEFDNELA